MHATEAASLLDEFTSLAMTIAGRWGCRFPWLADDFESEAGYALWRAALRFDPATSPTPFRALVRVVVRRACSKRVRSEFARNRAAFRGRPADADLDPLAAVEAPGPDPGAALDLAQLLAGLDPDARAALELRYLDGETWEAIGAARGVSGSAVRQQVGSAVARLTG